MNELSIVGLGPGPADQLNAAASRALASADEILVSDPTIPALDPYRSGARIVAIDETDGRLGQDLLDRIAATGAVVLAVLGTPRDAPWLPSIVERLTAAALATRIVPGRSLFDATAEVAGLDLAEAEIQLISGRRLVGAAESRRIDPFVGPDRSIDPVKPCVVADVDLPSAALVERALHAIYTPQHRLTVVRFPWRPDRAPAEAAHVDQLSALIGPGDRAWVYLPPEERLDDARSFDTLRYIVARLRGPGGCPWDREQTFASLKKYLLEETYEALDALDRAAYVELAGELGDVLLQVVMYSQLGREAKQFDLDDVLRAVNEKLIRRHPHVFGNVEASSSAEVLRNWERIKRAEKTVPEGSPRPEETFGGVPVAAPALVRADAVQSRAARYGWLPPEGVPSLEPLTRPDLSPEARRAALGETLFALVALGRRDHLDPEEALRVATNRFVAGFQRALAEARTEDHSFESLPSHERRRRVQAALNGSD